jgi:hypothetical protein
LGLVVASVGRSDGSEATALIQRCPLLRRTSHTQTSYTRKIIVTVTFETRQDHAMLPRLRGTIVWARDQDDPEWCWSSAPADGVAL